MYRTLTAAIAAIAAIAAGTALTACSASQAQAPATTAQTSQAPAAAASAPASPRPAPSPAQPQTAAAAHTAAARYLGLNSAGQFAAEYPLLAPAAQRAVPESTWTAVHQGCPSPSAGLADVIKDVTVTSGTAVITVTLAGAMSGIGSENIAFTYAHGRWGYSPSDLDIYQHGSVQADIAAARAKNLCA